MFAIKFDNGLWLSGDNNKGEISMSKNNPAIIDGQQLEHEIESLNYRGFDFNVYGVDYTLVKDAFNETMKDNRRKDKDKSKNYG